MDLKESVKVMKSLTKLAETIKSTTVDFEDVNEIMKFANDNSIEKLISIINHKTDDITDDNIIENGDVSPWIKYKPDIEWRKLYKENMVISAEGDIFDIRTNKLVDAVWIDGDLRVKMPEGQHKRLSPMVTCAYHVKSNLDDDAVIAFKDGDRRNLKPENLYWVEKYPFNMFERTVEDICLRIIDCDGDVNEIMKYYKNSKPTIDEKLILAILNKLSYKSISDKYFTTTRSGNKIKINKVDNNINNGSMGVDVLGLIESTNDIDLGIKMLNHKLTNNFQISDVDQAIMVCIIIRLHGIKNIQENISNTFSNFNIAESKIEYYRTDDRYHHIKEIIIGGIKSE